MVLVNKPLPGFWAVGRVRGSPFCSYSVSLDECLGKERALQEHGQLLQVGLNLEAG